MKRISKVLLTGYFQKRKKEWRSISLVVFFCVLFFTSIISSCLEAISSIEQFTKSQYGGHQFQVFGADEQHEMHSEAHVGLMELKGYFINEESLYRDAVILGTVDEMAKEIGSLTLMEGRMPEKKGEIAIESGVLQRMNQEVSIGEEIRLPVYWAEGGQYQEHISEEIFTVTGIIKDYSRIWMTDSDDPYRGYPGVWLSTEEREEKGIRVELLQFDTIKTSEQAEAYYQELLHIYGEEGAVEYNINCYIASEDDSLESKKSMYMSIAAGIMGAAIIIIMLIGVVSILSLGMEERKKQQKIMYQLGMNQRQCFFILCEQIYGASLIRIVSGIICSLFLAKGLKILLLRVLGIYVSDTHSTVFILFSIVPVFVTLGVAGSIIYRMINRAERKRIPKSKIPDYIQRICNGTFQVQRILSIVLLLATLLMILPVQLTINYYKDSFVHPLEKDVNMQLESTMTTGSMQISTGREGISLKDYERLEKVDGLKNMTYGMQLEAAKIVLPDSSMEKQFLKYRSDSETVLPIENLDVGDGIDYLSRDKEYYGYAKENVLIPCTIQGIEWSTIEQFSPYLIDGAYNEKEYLNGKETLAVVWEEEYEKAEYPIHVGDRLLLSNLVQTEASANYYEKPDEAFRIDTEIKIGAILKVPLEMAEKLGCVFTRGSFTFLRSLEALEQDGHAISFQNISFDYAKDADMRAADQEIKDIISQYRFVNFESRYEKQKAEQEFERVVFILGGSIWVLGVSLAVLLIYQKMISTMLLKKRQLYIMWCMGMHRDYLKKAFRRESVNCIGYAAVIALIVSIAVSRTISGIHIGEVSFFIIGSSVIAFVVLDYFLMRWIHNSAKRTTI